MASPNLDLVRSIYAAWERGDFSSADWADPEIEYVSHAWLSPGSSKGLVGMAEGFRDFLNAWEGLRVAPDEYRELDDERVLVLVNLRGRGKTSGLELGQMRQRGSAPLPSPRRQGDQAGPILGPRTRARRPRARVGA